MSFSTNSLAIYLGMGSALLAALNLLRLKNQMVKDWVTDNWKGFLRDENDEWPACIGLFGALAICNYTTGLRSMVVLGSACCTTGDAFACFLGRIFPNSYEIRKGKSVAGFLGAAVTTSVHSFLYMYLMGYLAPDYWTYLCVLFIGFWIGGMSDFLPSREIGLDDNFTTIVYGSHLWLLFFKMMPEMVVGLE